MVGGWLAVAVAVNGLSQQVDVKNADGRHILDVCNKLRNKTGRPIKRKW